jgi:transcriptional regulator with XRE-family HTH domain
MPKATDPLDLEVGRRVRALRLERGLSQAALADRLGLTFQQVQKYEKGSNRIGAGRLQRIARILKVPVSDLFDASPPTGAHAETLFEFVDTAAALRLLRAYSRIRNPEVKQALAVLAEKIAAEP